MEGSYDSLSKGFAELPERAASPVAVSKKQLVRAAEAAGQLETLAAAIQGHPVAAIKWATFDRMAREDLVPFEYLVGGAEALDTLFAAAQTMPG